MTIEELSKLLDDKLQGVATKDDLKTLASKADLKTVRSDLAAIERRLKKRFDELFDFLDRTVMENRKRIKRMDKRMNVQESHIRGLQAALN